MICNSIFISFDLNCMCNEWLRFIKPILHSFLWNKNVLRGLFANVRFVCRISSVLKCEKKLEITFLWYMTMRCVMGGWECDFFIFGKLSSRAAAVATTTTTMRKSNHFCHWEKDTQKIIHTLRVHMNVCVCARVAWHHGNHIMTIRKPKRMDGYVGEGKQGLKHISNCYPHTSGFRND